MCLITNDGCLEEEEEDKFDRIEAENCAAFLWIHKSCSAKGVWKYFQPAAVANFTSWNKILLLSRFGHSIALWLKLVTWKPSTCEDFDERNRELAGLYCSQWHYFYSLSHSDYCLTLSPIQIYTLDIFTVTLLWSETRERQMCQAVIIKISLLLPLHVIVAALYVFSQLPGQTQGIRL